MSENERVHELVKRWQKANEEGKNLSPGTLCADYPALLPEVTRRIQDLQRLDWMLDLNTTDEFPPQVPSEWSGEPRPESGQPVQASAAEDFPDKGAGLIPGSEPISGYKLVKWLGNGTFGEVWEAETKGGFHVALKFVRLDGHEEGELRALEIIKHLHHTNLVFTFNAWPIAGFLVIGMELAHGTLLDRFNQAVAQKFRGIPRDELLGYMEEAARAIDYLNKEQHLLGGNIRVGVQHCDIKPQNILLVGDGVKVADFSTAQMRHHTITRHGGGHSLAYAAPEFFHRKVSRWSDQYSLAVTYCHLSGGKLPFSGNNTAEIMAGHLMHEPDLTALLREEQDTVKRAMAKDPSKRWGSCKEFVESLQLLKNKKSQISAVEEKKPLPDRRTEAMGELVKWSELPADARGTVKRLIQLIQEGRIPALQSAVAGTACRLLKVPIVGAIHEFSAMTFKLKLALGSGDREEIIRILPHCLDALTKTPGLYEAYASELRPAVVAFTSLICSATASHERRRDVLELVTRFALSHDDKILTQLINDNDLAR